MPEPTKRIGVSGTGFIARSLIDVLTRHHAELPVAAVLTRRDPGQVEDLPSGLAATRSIDELVDRSDIVVECSGDVRHATEVVERAMQAGRPVVTMNSEFHVTVGSAFVGQGVLTEAEGDQPGCLAALAEEMRSMGFRPQVYGNMKGFLDRNPSPEQMDYWAKRQGISLGQVTAFTDGTKIQIEQALIANGMGAGIMERGLLGWQRDDTDQAARDYGDAAIAAGRPIADYILSSKQYAGVFITATHDDAQRIALKYFKLGEGPMYVMYKRNHLCSLEIPRTLRRIAQGGPVLLDNGSSPEIGVVAVAKRALAPGEAIPRAIGGFDLRGEAVRIADAVDCPPIGLLDGARVCRRVEPGQTLRWDDIEPIACRALDLYRRRLSR